MQTQNISSIHHQDTLSEVGPNYVLVNGYTHKSAFFSFDLPPPSQPLSFSLRLTLKGKHGSKSFSFRVKPIVFLFVCLLLSYLFIFLGGGGKREVVAQRKKQGDRESQELSLYERMKALNRLDECKKRIIAF